MTPCKAADTDDWFIEKTGRQYIDEPVLTPEQIKKLRDEHPPKMSARQAADLADEIEAATEEQLRLNLIARRKARDACYECPIRLDCLQERLQSGAEYGIWGGYYPEELRQIERERDRRDRRRSSVD